MQRSNSLHKILSLSGVAASLVLAYGSIFAQTKPVPIPDAQVEANVLKALAGAPQLADQSITSTTVFGTVTLSGSVGDEASRDLADKVVSNTTGVQKVVDQITIGTVAPTSQPQQANSSAQGAGESTGTNPNLQSDGTIAPSSQGQGNSNAGAAPPKDTNQGTYQGAPPQGGQYPAYGRQPQGTPHPPQGQYPPNGSYSQQPYAGSQQPYAGQSGQPQRPYVSQKGGDAVIVPSGSMVRVRINQGMDSKHTAVGTVFDGVILNDVVAGGSIAIPRGAAVRGSVVESHPAGDFKGKGELKLQLTQLQLGGREYPIVTDFWWHQGADKTGNTVGNTVGLGAVGALIGAVAGGGVGAAVGAGVGGVAGLGVSASQHRGEAALPSEAIVMFHLTQPADVTTVSQAELNRLGAGVPAGGPPQMQRRYYPPPPPPPPYYGPGYYPPPY